MFVYLVKLFPFVVGCRPMSVALVFAANCSCVKSRGVLVCWCSRLCDFYRKKIGRDVTGRTRTWFALYTHAVRVCVKLLRSTHACVLWYYRFVLQLRLVEHATMLYYARSLVTLDTLLCRCLVVRCVEVLSLCLDVVDTSACTLTQFTVACCIFSVHVT